MNEMVPLPVGTERCQKHNAKYKSNKDEHWQHGNIFIIFTHMQN